jgi:hypothetical protein
LYLEFLLNTILETTTKIVNKYLDFFLNSFLE